MKINDWQQQTESFPFINENQLEYVATKEFACCLKSFFFFCAPDYTCIYVDLVLQHMSG